MNIYIAFLRGINVGGRNVIKMADLKQTFEAIGLGRVQTYIQSGNVLFESNEDEESLTLKIEQKIVEDYGLSITVVLRTAEELERIVQNCPFSKEQVLEAESLSQVESLYVSLMAQIPSKEKVEQLSVYESQEDMYKIKGRDIYLLFRHSIRNSKLANNLQKLDVPATVRNWKTLSKLSMLAKTIKH
ncbi:uncharacterized protein (DUF1697 family) [Anaerosolibacter carboniphilus]|uniref:Uncharacterized protein (DUF1697 family) n=1 Tax=Anaerosolibacter carboniphilus TaxID=1417629 RepID=A0A841L7F6_9FIRM|nr:DUF1697 domain-containing protein [Anaerosolibacter carboniphilus]MBB6218329.1 uncharacterized protein (DUF1697 family) [Anaerosolibacter carboniphilus]